MHEMLFANAAFAEGATVLRLALRPYSIGHEILLWKVANPLVTYTPESFKELPEIDRRKHLFTAVFICERTWAENHRPWKWIGLAAFFRAHCVTDIEVDRFRAYRDAGSKDFPTVPMPRTPGASFHYFGSPDEARLLLFLSEGRMHQTLGYESAFDVPLGLARMLYSAKAESEGNLYIENYQDVQNKIRLEAYEKAHPESTLAVGEEAVQASAEEWNRLHPDTPVVLPHAPKENGGHNG
jgi:hypothetical protein